MLGQDIAAKAVFNVDGESPQHIYLLISQHELLPLLLERKQLLDNIQVNGNACTERHTEQQEHHPYLVLNAELIPQCAAHRSISAVSSRSRQCAQETLVNHLIWALGERNVKTRDQNPKTGPRIT